MANTAKNYKDVTDEVLGTKSEPTKTVPVKKDSAPADINGLEVPEGFEPLNPPVPADAKPVTKVAGSKVYHTVSAETTASLKNIEKLLRSVSRNFAEIGYELHYFQKNKAYRELGFKTFDEFAKSQFGLGRSAAYNFIKVCVKFCVRDDNNVPTKVLKKEYAKFNSSQLVAMLGLDEEVILNVDPETAVREIKRLTKNSGQSQDGTGDDTDGDVIEEDSGDTDGKPKKRNARDTTIPSCRISMATGMTWDEVMTENIRKSCEYYLNDEMRTKDGNDYRIEICISYPDKSAI